MGEIWEAEMEIVRGKRRERKRRNKKKIHSEEERKDKIRFEMASPQKYMPQCTSVCKLCSFSQLPICQFAIHSYQTLSKALLWCSPRHQNEALSFPYGLIRTGYDLGLPHVQVKPLQGTYCNRSLQEAHSQYDSILLTLYLRWSRKDCSEGISNSVCKRINIYFVDKNNKKILHVPKYHLVRKYWSINDIKPNGTIRNDQKSKKT